MDARWLFLVLGLVLGVVVREIGNWAPVWSRKLIERRAGRISEKRGAAFAPEAVKRLEAGPGDWSKLIFTVGWLRPAAEPLPMWADASASDRVRLLKLTLFATAGIAGVSFVFILADVFNVNLGLALPLGLVWGALVFGVDRLTIGNPPHWVSLKSLVRYAPRLLFALCVAYLLSTTLSFALFSEGIKAEASKGGETDSITAQFHAFDEVVPVTVRFLLFALFLLLETLPMVASILSESSGDLRRAKSTWVRRRP